MNTIKIKNIDFYFNDEDDPVINWLKKGHLFGESNFNLLDKFMTNSPDSYLLDCGGHIGTFALPAALQNYQVMVVEGAPNNVECMKKTFQSFNNVSVHHEILSDKVGKCSFSHTSGPFGCLIEDENGPLSSNSIDNIVGDKKICGIKLDIEGGEENALKGASNTLSTSKPPILMEINGHCLRLRGETPKNVLSELERHGYSAYFIINGYALKVDKNKLFPFCVIDVICLHDSIGPISAPSLDDYQINQLIVNNYQNSNDDCKKYFNSIGYYGT